MIDDVYVFIRICGMQRVPDPPHPVDINPFFKKSANVIKVSIKGGLY